VHQNTWKSRTPTSKATGIMIMAMIILGMIATFGEERGTKYLL